ncbi:hypothetical protein [Natrinema soli]|uniref:Uncharacterized protein n=1 Tax=Natrinema soli TaxID=1930624 RepID=A0ABD5SFA2_9EURY|nr:hypothetical protein [Natrinema soli]
MRTRSDSAGTACTVWDNSECEGTPYCLPRCPRFEGKDGAPLLVRPYESDDRDALVSMYGDLDQYSRPMGLRRRRSRRSTTGSSGCARTGGT